MTALKNRKVGEQAADAAGLLAFSGYEAPKRDCQFNGHNRVIFRCLRNAVRPRLWRNRSAISAKWG